MNLLIDPYKKGVFITVSYSFFKFTAMTLMDRVMCLGVTFCCTMCEERKGGRRGEGLVISQVTHPSI